MQEQDLQALGKAQAKFRKVYFYRSLSMKIISFLISVIMIAVMLILMFLFVLDIYHVSGNGMAPTVKSGSYIIGSRISYICKDPARGDVVISNGHLYRIVGMPGEQIDLYGGHIYANGDMLLEDALPVSEMTYASYAGSSYKVPEDQYYVLTDDRDCYDGSRTGLFIDKDSIKGKIISVFGS